MRKIILLKNDFVKAIFTNISAYELCQLLNSFKTSISNIPIIILNKSLIDLIENDSSASGADVFTIIGQNKPLRKNKTKHPKGIEPIKKESSKVNVLKNENKKAPQENPNQNSKKEIKTSKEHETIHVSEQKNLITKVITITPNISPKTKMIMGEIQKQKEKINKQKQSDKKEKTITKAPAKIVKPTIKKQETAKANKNKPAKADISKKEKSKEITKQDSINKANNNLKINISKSKTPRYSLQKKKSPGLIALFSAAFVPVLFGIGLASIAGHKRLFPNVLVASSLAIIGFGMFSNNAAKTRSQNKQLVKKINSSHWQNSHKKI